MPETQLELVPAHKPLLDKFGSDFFRAVPALPGVYVMTGRDERILYVGQSANLHARLGTYKNARAGKTSRKTLRLVHAVESITWETCSSAKAALLRENALLRLYRPRFNRVNTYPPAYSFISLKLGRDRLDLGRTTDPAAPGPLFGAFKAHVLAGYSGLLRLLWAALNHPEGIHAFPRQLLSARPPNHWALEMAPDNRDHLGALVGDFLEGCSDGLLGWIVERLPHPETLHPFHRALQETDLDALKTFFLSGPRRNRALLRRHELPGRLIPQDRLDDLLAEHAERLSREATTRPSAQPKGLEDEALPPGPGAALPRDSSTGLSTQL